MSAVMLLVGCEGLRDAQGSPGDVIRQTAQHLDAGSLAQANAIPSMEPMYEIRHLDPTDPLYCTVAGVEARLERAAYSISRSLLMTTQADSVTRYAIAKHEIETTLQLQDRIFEDAGYCRASRGQLALAYSEARQSLAMAAEEVLGGLRAKAAEDVGADVDAATEQALMAYREAQSEKFAANCKERRHRPERAVTEDPLLTQADRVILQNCARAGL